MLVTFSAESNAPAALRPQPASPSISPALPASSQFIPPPQVSSVAETTASQAPPSTPNYRAFASLAPATSHTHPIPMATNEPTMVFTAAPVDADDADDSGSDGGEPGLPQEDQDQQHPRGDDEEEEGDEEEEYAGYGGAAGGGPPGDDGDDDGGDDDDKEDDDEEDEKESEEGDEERYARSSGDEDDVSFSHSLHENPPLVLLHPIDDKEAYETELVYPPRGELANNPNWPSRMMHRILAERQNLLAYYDDVKKEAAEAALEAELAQAEYEAECEQTAYMLDDIASLHGQEVRKNILLMALGGSGGEGFIYGSKKPMVPWEGQFAYRQGDEEKVPYVFTFPLVISF